MKIILSLITLALIFSSCKSTYSDEDIKKFDKRIVAFLKKKDIKCERSASGLHYKIIKEGEGRKIQYNDRVSFTYRGEFLNGKMFDEKLVPIEFDVKILIGAWKEAVLQLRKGGKIYMVTPPQIAYGEEDLKDIPKGSILVFELEVIDVK